jgi:hypothetical protein
VFWPSFLLPEQGEDFRDSHHVLELLGARSSKNEGAEAPAGVGEPCAGASAWQQLTPPHSCEVEAMVELITVRLADLVSARLSATNEPATKSGGLSLSRSGGTQLRHFAKAQLTIPTTGSQLGSLIDIKIHRPDDGCSNSKAAGKMGNPAASPCRPRTVLLDGIR